MHIQQVAIRNFRCFQKLDVPLERLTTIVGENGSGKTAILDAIYYALKPRSAGARITEQDFNSADAGDVQIELTFSKSFTARVPDFPTTQPVPCSGIRFLAKRREKAAGGRLFCGGFVNETTVVPDSSVTQIDGGWQVIRKNGKPFKFTEHNLRSVDTDNLPQCFLFDKDRTRQAKVGFRSTMTQFVEDLDWRFRRGIEAHRPALISQWNAYFELILNCVDRSRIDATLKKCQQLAESLLGVSLEGLELSPINLETPFSKAFLSIRTGLNQIDQGALGSGVSMILIIALLETLAKSTGDSFVILIDEPELHLHPQLQQSLRAHLGNLSGQIIASTHAESMIRLGEWQSIKRLTRAGTCAPSEDVLDELLCGRSVREHLTDITTYYRDKTLLLRENNELLFARAAVLVEGPAEKFSIPTLAALAEQPIKNLTIISAWGKQKLLDYQALCRAFAIPFFSVWDADSDGSGDDAKFNENLKACAATGCWFEFPQSYESEFGIGKRAKHSASVLLDKVASIKRSDISDNVNKLLGMLASFNATCASELEMKKAKENPRLF